MEIYDLESSRPRARPQHNPDYHDGRIDGTFHVCAVAWFNSLDATCQWWGPANVNGTFCVARVSTCRRD